MFGNNNTQEHLYVPMVLFSLGPILPSSVSSLYDTLRRFFKGVSCSQQCFLLSQILILILILRCSMYVSRTLYIATATVVELISI